MKRMYEKPTIAVYEMKKMRLLAASKVRMYFYDDEEEEYSIDNAL